MTIKHSTDITVEITLTSLTEFASLSNLTPPEIAELVEIGVLIPSGVSPNDWAFNDQTLMLMRRLRRLEADFELELDLKTLALGYRLLGYGFLRSLRDFSSSAALKVAIDVGFTKTYFFGNSLSVADP